MITDPLATDRLNDLPQVPAPMIFHGARVEVSRQGKWIPGTIVGTVWDDERGGLVDVDLDRPDASGHTQVFVSPAPHRIRAIGAAAAVQQQAAE